MSLDRWENAYRNHPAWAQLTTLTEHLDDAPERADNDEIDHYDRLRWLTNHLTEVRDNPAILVSTPALDNLNSALAQLVGQVAAWVSNTGGQYLVAAGAGHTDVVLDALRAWPVTKDRMQRGLLAAGREFEKESGATLQQLRDEVEEARQSLADVTAHVTTTRTASETDLLTLRAEIAQAHTEVTAQTTRLDTALNGVQDTFARAEEQRAAAHTTQIEEMKDHTRSVIAEAKTAAADALTEQAAAAQKQLAELELANTQATELVGTIGLVGTATGYGLYAKEQCDSANKWRIVAMAAFGFSFAWFLVTLWKTQLDAHTAWQLVVFKLAGSVALLAGGAYASHESGEHRVEERHAKSVQLDLAALDPFLATLNEDEQHAIRAAAARRLFTGERQDSTATKDESDGGTTSANGLVSTAAAAVVALKEIASNGKP